MLPEKAGVGNGPCVVAWMEAGLAFNPERHRHDTGEAGSRWLSEDPVFESSGINVNRELIDF